MNDKNFEMAHKIAEAVAEAGGHTYYVGGFVRDQMLRRENKDIDVEIHGISAAALEAILDRLGERIVMGASFGIYGLRHYTLDISMPRRSGDPGRGQKNFADYVDPFVGEEQAARRRDFTMNALMQDVLTGEVLDFFGGGKDLENGVIRHVDPRTFSEDPLRVFRAAQFAARFGFVIAEETVTLASGLSVQNIPAERIIGETEKALLRSEKPSVYFSQLRAMRQLADWYPELLSLIGRPPRGSVSGNTDAWAHTMQLLDAAAQLRDSAVRPFWFLTVCLCTDFGAADEYGQPADSDAAAEQTIRAMLGRLTNEVKYTAYVRNMRRMLAQLEQYTEREPAVLDYMELFDRCICPEDLLLLRRAEALIGQVRPQTLEKEQTMADTYRARMEKPCLMGKDLICAGAKPGPRIQQALDRAHRLHLNGKTKEEQLQCALSFLQAGPQEHDETADPQQNSAE